MNEPKKRLAITTKLNEARRTVRIDFSEPCAWVDLSPFEARSLAQSLAEKADALEGKASVAVSVPSKH